ncbi:MAG TPA: amidase [Candidatus Limnocylindria bacterium]|nr:amidase [Candidatus Limnocylindria bacterium]
MLSEDILYMPVRELGNRIRSKQISPVELTESYLARSERLGPKLNAYVTITRELALQQARAAEKEIADGKYRGPLHGIPYAAKDLLAVKGYPTTWGAKPYADQAFNYNATVIEQLSQAGAVLIGKAAMIELAGGMNYRFASASLTGAAKNPWNEGCWTCGSSSGSGAIVSAALAAFAIGTETWGSIICPSAYCGVSGLRPTFGRVSRYGAMALAYSLDKIGPMGRTAEDCALILSAIAGHDPLDRSSLPPAEASFLFAAPESAPLRIGVLTNAWEKPDQEIKAAVDGAIAVLKQHGASTSDAKLPEGPYEAAAGLIVGVEGAAAFRSLIESGKVAELVDPLGQIGGYLNEQLSADDYMRALQIRGIFQKKVDALFDDFDVLVAASLPIAATTLETNLETDLTFSDPLGGIGNLCGLPALSVPCGFTSKKLPIGIQFIGRVRNDRAVVAAASLFQRNTDWHTRRPPIN